jgi:hypothetical protein
MKPLKLILFALISAMQTMFRTPRLLTRHNEALLRDVENEGIATVKPASFTVPYGRYPDAQSPKVMQVFNREAATMMKGLIQGSPTAWVKSVMNHGLHRALGKRPVFIGHPYAASSKDKSADKRSYGWITDVNVRDNEAEFVMEPTPDGRKLIEDGAFISGSPSWIARDKDNESFPFALTSFGLTNMPNIPGVELHNEDQQRSAETLPEENDGEPVIDQDNEAKQWMRDLRSKLYLEPDATMDQVTAAIASREAEINRMRADVAAYRQQLADEQAKVLSLTTTIANNEATITTLREADNEHTSTLEAERGKHSARAKALATHAVHAAVVTGRITLAERENEAAAIMAAETAEAVDAAFAKLMARPQRYKTTSIMSGAAAQMRLHTIHNEIVGDQRSRSAKHAAVAKRQRELEAQGMRTDLAFTQAYNETFGMSATGL